MTSRATTDKNNDEETSLEVQFGFSDFQGEDRQLARLLEANGLSDASIPRLFESIVEKFPLRTAISFNGESSSYSALNKDSNVLSNYLVRKAFSGSRIAICIEPSYEVVVAIIAVLKAGCTYVPIDTKNARSRIRSTLEDVEPAAILTKGSSRSSIAEFSGEVIDIERLPEDCLRNTGNPKTEVGGSDFAYIIYTSGSTGKPKGVPISHYNVVHLMRSADLLFDFSELDVWTCFHSVSFDFSVWEIWGALLKGGRLVVVPYSTSRNFPRFYELLVDEKVSILNLTPTAFRILIQTDNYMSKEADSIALRYVVLGGESLNLSSLAPWFEKYGDSEPKVVNMYGITETTVHVTYKRISKADLANKASLIGLPLPGVELYLLDEHGDPCLSGESGEICVGGLGVSSGYINRRSLTREKFVSNPYRDLVGTKLYRSGDLGRVDSNGELCHLGRMDSQVQIRGFRVELGEIEAAARELEFVQDVVATVYGKDPDDPKIILVYRTNSDETGCHKDLRRQLKPKLPDYMLPDFSQSVEEFPLNNNGKLDLSSLNLK